MSRPSIPEPEPKAEPESDRPTPRGLSFTSHNPAGLTTLLLIHGAFGSPRDLEPLVKQLLPEDLISRSNGTGNTSARRRTGVHGENSGSRREGEGGERNDSSSFLVREMKIETKNQSETGTHPHLPTADPNNKYCHILTPSLPMHDSSSHITPLTIPNTVHLLANLITCHAKSKKAHVFGYSLGAHIAAELASTHPELVSSLFVTGFNLFGDTRWKCLLPMLLFTGNLVEGMIVKTGGTLRRLKGWVTGVEDERDEYALCKVVIGMCFSDRELGWIDGDWTRVLVVAARREGWMPKDRLGDARRLFEYVRFGSRARTGIATGDGDERGRSRVVQHTGLGHCWPIDEPGFMGRTMRAWVGRGEVLEGFEDIES